MSLFLNASLLLWVVVTLLWLYSIIIKNASIVDVFWGFGFVIVNIYYVFMAGAELNARNWIILFLVGIWGLRLSVYIFIRNFGKGEDFRYQEFRKKYGAHRYWWFSYFQTFLLQGILIMIVSLPLLGISKGNSGNLNILDYVAIIIWMVGFIFEAGGDYQLYNFKRNKTNRGKVLDTGFWKYTRHPNYFGDTAVWWSYALLCVAAGSYWYIIGSVVMTILIIKVSGVSLLEPTLKETKPQYKDYIKKTSAFIPWFPKK